MKKRCVTVYGASSAEVEAVFKQEAETVGQQLALRGATLVCGAGRTGLMASSIDGAIAKGGEAVGVIPRFMVENGWHHKGLSKMIVTEDMHQRKAQMLTMADGVIALPGGVGTLEELLEAITWRQLGLYHGNIVILNTEGYYEPLQAMLRQTIECRFMRRDHRHLWQVATTAAEAVEMALATDARSGLFSQKIDITGKKGEQGADK
ncbi:MAG: TIGR00730 family Rossman fold protein [Muribaculaceae bacterium]|nr:TIGR00730 family Rossman fold protein [Muribaculaceae bacterium]